MNSNRDQNKSDNYDLKDEGTKLCSNVKIQNKIQKDLNVNNNVEDNDISNPLLVDRSRMLCNGLYPLEQAHKSYNSDQSKYKFTSHPTNLRKNANACPTGAEMASNHTSNSVPINSMSESLTFASVPTFIEPLPSCSSFNSILVEDTDLRNNVDYVTRIEKCPPKVSCSSNSGPDADRASSLTSYPSPCPLNDIGSNIGSTSHGTCCILRPNINNHNCRDSSAGPSGLSRRFRERRDSSSGNEGDLSDSEDYCIYTYKGNDDSAMAHCVNLTQMRENREIQEHQSGRSSPEMDFLEMDFDPGPSCEQDTGDSDLASINEDIQNIAMDNVETDQVLLNDLSGGKVVLKQTTQNAPDNEICVITNQNNGQEQQNAKSGHLGNSVSKKVYSSVHWQLNSTSSLKPWEASSMQRHTISCPLPQSFGYHTTSGDLISPGDNRDIEPEMWTESSTISVTENLNLNSCKINLSSNLYHRMMAKKLMLDKQAAFNQSRESNLENEINNEHLDSLLQIDKVMLWTEQEAIAKQVTQIGTSACGATAAINALYALEIPFGLEILIKGVGTRLREPGASLPRYLLSRSQAGATHEDIARGISLATNDMVITKFFSFYPERKVSLSHWLQYWISRGAAPIATLNLQHCGEGHDIPDAWHHQLIFGVSQAGIYLANPLQCVPEQTLWHLLVSPSILLIRRADVLAHWNATTDLTPLISMDYKWRKINVLGQVVNIVREIIHGDTTPSATHIRIPASYKSGITLVMHKTSPAVSELLCAEQLQLL